MDEPIVGETKEETIDENMTVSLENEVFEDLKVELSTDTTFDETLLLSKVKNALREVKRARKYPTYYTDEQIERDMYDYFSNIRKIALYDYNQIGAEGQSSIGENGVNRTFVDRNSLFAGIIPLSRI